MASSSFSRLIRFIATDNKVYYGDAIVPSGAAAPDLRHVTSAHPITGGDIFSAAAHVDRTRTLTVKKLLAPLAPAQLRTVRCLGLNYTAHAAESNMPIPQFPVLFYKPVTAVAGPTDAIPVPRMAQEGEGLDYECELVVVIGKPAKDVSEETALDYVFGYAVGNDVSQRDWQIKRGGGQWSLGKGFDGWAPMGPAVVAPSLIPNPNALNISTKLNGKVVQNSSTKDQIFGVAKTISFLSRGTTLLPGDLIFTGTPQGVGMGMKPQQWLKDGDEVEISLEGVGSIVNKVVFEKDEKARL